MFMVSFVICPAIPINFIYGTWHVLYTVQLGFSLWEEHFFRVPVIFLLLEKWIENSESVNKYLYNGVINNAVCLPHSKIMILPKRAQQFFFFFSIYRYTVRYCTFVEGCTVCTFKTQNCWNVCYGISQFVLDFSS